MEIKHADFKGSWYPGDASGCEREIQQFLTDPLIDSVPDKSYVAGIVPHAGWYFSGSIACNVIRLISSSEKPDAILIFGKHLRPSSPATIMVEGLCETPLGNLRIHNELASEIAQKLSLKIEHPSHTQPENTIELQLPFIRYFFDDIPIVPIGVPPSDMAREIGTVSVAAARDLGLTVNIIGSTDLTHYGPNYGFTPAGSEGAEWVKTVNDPKMIQAMLCLNETDVLTEALSNYNACCGGAVAATVAAARELGVDKGEQVAYTTSYDKSPGESFVGYVGVVF